MSNNQKQHQQGQKDANQGKRPKNTQGINHQAANSYNAGYNSAKNGGKK